MCGCEAHLWKFAVCTCGCPEHAFKRGKHRDETAVECTCVYCQTYVPRHKADAS